jgi:DNA-binding response OmpR family regulator
LQRTGSILVVDNDAAIVEMIVDVLTEEGYVAYSARDGTHALAAIVRHPPALLLLNLWMPGMSGAELIAQLRAVSLLTMPIVLVTAAPGEATPLLVPGSITCLAKPFNLDDLLAHVARYVRPVYSWDCSRSSLSSLTPTPPSPSSISS